MPYIPPPPRPPTPPRPFIPPAPRPNLHMQQQQRFHQQQQFHQQQRVHQQQIQNQQRLQQNLQMDHTKRQQALQQQQQHFQKQQDLFRKQRQDQERIRQQNQQQQDRLRREEEQRKQQQLLRNLQHSNVPSVGETGGTTVVHVAPGIQLGVSGFTVNGSPGVQEVSQPPSQPPAPPLSPYELPPPYQQGPPSSAPPLSATVPPVVVAPTNGPLPQGPAAAPALPSENRVILKDGTQVVIQQDDEILFIGPTGVQMVVNCLPLYMPPQDAVQPALSINNSEESSDDQNDTDSQKRGRKKSKNSPKKPQHLRKTKSLTSIAIAEIELSDEEKQSRSDDEVLEDTRKSKKKKKSRMNSFGAHYSVQVHRQVEPRQAMIEETDAALPSTHTYKSIETTVSDPEQSFNSEKAFQSVKPTNDDKSTKVDDNNPSPVGNGTNSSPQEPDEVVHKKPNKSPVTKSKSLGSVSESEDTSDPEDNKQGFEVNYLETTTTLPRLKRSSGSVSFPQRMTISVLATSSVIAEESSLTSQQYCDSQPIPQAVPISSPEEAKDSQEEPKDSQEGTKDSQEEPKDSQEETKDSQEEPKDSQEGSKDSEKIDNENSNTREDTDSPLLEAKETEASECGQKPTANKPENEQSTMSKVLAPNAVEQVKEQDTTADVSPTSRDVSPAASAQKSSTPPQEPSADHLASKESALLAMTPSPSPPSTPSHSPLTVTLLPPSPMTMNGDYVERSGWLTKLSHRKGMFGDKWQKRYFVLHRSWLYYFKKYGDSNPKGVIRLLPTGWSKTITQGTLRMPDAVVSSSDKGPGIMSVLRCLAVHRPNNFAAALSTLLEEDGVAEAFRSQTVSVSNPQHVSRTFYVTASSNDERNAWVKAINHNIRAYSHSAEALTTATKELKSMLRAVKSNMPPKDIPSLLLLLHTRREKVAKAHTAAVESH